MRLGLGLSICDVRSSVVVPPFDVTTLSLTGLWQGGNYNAGTKTWTGTASAGTSGSNNLTEATNPPTAGTLNSLAVPVFNGTNQLLSGAAASTYFSTTALSGWVLVQIPSLAGAGGTASGGGGGATSNLQIFGTAFATQAYVYAVATGGIGFGTNDGADKSAEATFAASTWQLVQYRHTGSAIEIRVNNGTWSTLACGTISSLSGTVQFAKSLMTGSFLACTIGDIGTANTSFSNATFNNVRSYITGKYGVTV